MTGNRRPSSIVHRPASSIYDRRSPTDDRRWTIDDRRSFGFTLIELLIVITLIVVLAGIGLATYSTSVIRAKEAVLRKNLFQMLEAIDKYHADRGNYPPDLSALVTNGYLRQIPKDPITDSTDTWQIVMADSDASDPNAAPGVYAVKSGAPGTALDGTPYADLP